jgi:tRNA nucleotidyltransferase/poly(A) polymerase
LRFSEIREILVYARKFWDVYLVGGAVRDWVIRGFSDFNVKDCDFVIADDLGGFVSFLESRGFKVSKFSRFGTAELSFKGLNVDVALMRREFYDFPGALPKVEFVKDIKTDVLRRDFTVNSLYFDGEKIIDFLGGLDDISMKTIRPVASFSDDPTRIFRGIRYKNLLNFQYSKEFFKFLEEGKNYILNVSANRLLNELRNTSVISKGAMVSAFSDMANFDVLSWGFEGVDSEIVKSWKRFYVGKPSKYRWVILLAPFSREGLPLEGAEKRCLEILKIPKIEENVYSIHSKFYKFGDLEVLTYLNWKAENVRIFLKYLKVRKLVKIKLYPMEERVKSFEESMDKLNVKLPKPEFLYEDPKGSGEKGKLKAKIESYLIASRI